MDRSRAPEGVSSGESSREYSEDESGADWQHGGSWRHIAPEEAGDGSRSQIRTLAGLRKAMELGTLSQVVSIKLDGQNLGRGHFMVAQALKSGQMSVLDTLSLFGTSLEDERSEAIGDALASAKFPSLRDINLQGNAIGTKGVEALGRAIRSGNLEHLEYLSLPSTGINDDGLATLANAIQYGGASVLPNLAVLNVNYNPSITGFGVLSLAEALKSGRLDSLQGLGMQSSILSQEGATALVSAFALNSSLTALVWVDDPILRRQLEHLKRRNQRYKDIRAGLEGRSMVKASFGKIYLCGDPKMGKTTLCRTLNRTRWASLGTWEKRPHAEPRTAGIDISEIHSKDGTSLSVWDMAGQQDYHLVHNAFFPALSFSDGKTNFLRGGVTLFVIVCNSKTLPEEVEKQLDYWLRYIASSIREATEQIRDVFVVLNNMGGVKEVERNCQYWKVLLQEKREKFNGLLDVHINPFLVDVRRRVKVSALKRCLLEHSKKWLKQQIVPNICDTIQRWLPRWSKERRGFPALDLNEFLEQVEEKDSSWPREAISSAITYLDEAGVLILVDKSFPPEWCIPSPELIVLDPNWLCKEIIGNMFLSEDMVKGTERSNIFRKKLDSTTGSISLTDFKDFFEAKWGQEDCNSLIAILLWLGLCYKGKDYKLFIPSLIDGNWDPGDVWQSHGKDEVGEEQWVMGFSIQHLEDGMSLAPMSLWHRFQVQIAQDPKFNKIQNSKLNEDEPENTFVAGKYWMVFTVDYMSVRIEVDAGKAAPTFDEISIFVKPPLSAEDKLDKIRRKQLQVNLADDLVNILLDLWNEICGRVKYVHKVAWPWPVSHPRPVYKNRNVKVAEVKKWLLRHGMGRKMQWVVGHNSTITEDQLLSTKEKHPLILKTLRNRMQEAVHLRIYPPELIHLIEESEISLDGDKMKEPEQGSDGIEMAASRLKSTAAKKVNRLLTVQDKVIHKQKTMKEENVESTLQGELAALLNEQQRVFCKLQDTNRFFKEEKERTCPNLIYLGKSGPRGSGVRAATLEESLSPSLLNARLQFACEAMYGRYRPHQVKDQQGLVISEREPFLKIVPWLVVSLTVLLISAELPTSVAAPGSGLALPDFQQLQPGKRLSDGIFCATGYSMQDLERLMTDSMGQDSGGRPFYTRDMYGKSRAAVTNLIGKLSQESYEKFGLRKVHLADTDGSGDRDVWICTDCYEKFRESSQRTVGSVSSKEGKEGVDF